MSFVKFSMYPMVARISWIQEVLGVPITGKRDKATIKALTKFQKSNNITPNGVCDETTYDRLVQSGGSQVKIRSK